jgi:hypothetical protein
MKYTPRYESYDIREPDILKDQPDIPKLPDLDMGTLLMLFQTLRAQGNTVFEARSKLEILIRAENYRTQPPLPVPTEILLHEDGLNFTIFTCKHAYAGDEVRVYRRKPEPPPVERGPGASDTYDWDGAHAYWYNLCQCNRTEGKPEPLPKELGKYFEDCGDPIPDERTLRRKVNEWRQLEGNSES